MIDIKLLENWFLIYKKYKIKINLQRNLDTFSWLMIVIYISCISNCEC